MLSFINKFTNISETDVDDINTEDIEELYDRPKSFTGYLPYKEYCYDTGLFILEDGESLGIFFEAIAIPSEAKSEKYMKEKEDAITNILCHSIPEEDDPWVLQVYVQDDYSLTEYSDQLEAYIKPEIRETAYTQEYLRLFRQHYKDVVRKDGYFFDEQVSGSEWSGKVRRTRCCLYRRGGSSSSNPDYDAVEEIQAVFRQVINECEEAGIIVTQMAGKDVYKWLVNWFNPDSYLKNQESEELTELIKFPVEEEAIKGNDFSNLLLFTQPEVKNGYMYFDDRPHLAITVDRLRTKPKIGHLTAERSIGERLYAPFDKFPVGTIFSFTVVIKPQDEVELHVTNIKNASKGESADADITANDASETLYQMSQGNKLFPTVCTIFISADNEKSLRKTQQKVNSLLLTSGLHAINEKNALLPYNTYIRQLPMNYEPARDKHARIHRFFFARHLARLLPFYGRARGTGNPGLTYFNRGAEPFWFDPLNKKDREKNAFGLVLGPPGSGKSAWLVAFLMMLIAVYRVRIFIIEKGNSFDLVGKHAERYGLTVNHKMMHTKHKDVTLPPFVDAIKMLDQEEAKQQELNHIADSMGEDYEQDLSTDNDSDEDDEERDILGELELTVRVMITGGDKKEESKMKRSDRFVIRKAIMDAASNVREENKRTGKERIVKTEDIANAMSALSKEEGLSDLDKQRISDMSKSIGLFTTGIAGQFFNREGSSWEEADITTLDMGILSQEGYEDQMTVAYMSLMSRINAIVERDQYLERPTIVVTDEAHLITTNPLLAKYLVKIAKMWRKLGAWLWLATQNLSDFPDDAAKMLNMIEFWILMVCPKEEIQNIARFKDLTEDQTKMLIAARKEPGKYTEGVVISPALKAQLFRNVPVPISLALAQTDKDEKANRQKIMTELNCDEVEAAESIAEEIRRSR